MAGQKKKRIGRLKVWKEEFLCAYWVARVTASSSDQNKYLRNLRNALNTSVKLSNIDTSVHNVVWHRCGFVHVVTILASKLVFLSVCLSSGGNWEK